MSLHPDNRFSCRAPLEPASAHRCKGCSTAVVSRRAKRICQVNGDGKFDLLLQANDNNEYLRLSIGSSFGIATVVADVAA